MKRLLFIAITALSAATASAKVPETLRRQSTDTDAIAFFNAMDDFEVANPDGTSLVTYDAYPDGKKIITRRIDYHRNDDAAQDRICAVFDSITARPDNNRITVRNINGKATMLRVYKIKDSDGDNTVDFSSNGGAIGSGSTSACVNIKGDVVIAQRWTVKAKGAQGSPDLTKLDAAIADLAAGEKVHRGFSHSDAPRLNTGGLRLRDPAPPSTNYIEYDRIIVYDAPVEAWIDLHHKFMDLLGSDGDLSLTYYRNYRMVTLVDMATKSIYAARFKSGSPDGGAPGKLAIIVGKYAEEPFLPADDWTVVTGMPDK